MSFGEQLRRNVGQGRAAPQYERRPSARCLNRATSTSSSAAASMYPVAHVVSLERPVSPRAVRSRLM
jgi:hypothetical protein